jgi:peptidoglycan/xylan/chitin deacetylase (PgdA/CDA1 family)
MRPFPAQPRNLTRWAMLSVAVISLVIVAAFQFKTNGLSAAEASPMKAPTRTVTVPPVVKRAEKAQLSIRTTAPRSPMVSSPLVEDIEPRLPHTPVRPTPTGVVFPDPIFAPKFDGVARTASVPILMYHYISTSPSANDKIRIGLSVTPEMFEAQVKLLVDNGFTTISLFDLYNHVATGKPLPDKPIILTFDDGYVDNYEQAFPILKKHGQTGTFFVLTGPADVKDPAYMSWDMIKAMSKAGMDMQLHAKEHVDLRHRRYEDLVWQVIGGRQSIEGHTGKPVVFMAYPSGKYDSTVVKFLSDNNFWGAVTTQPGRTHSVSDALTWTRVRIAGQLRLADFARLLGIPRP